jgi:glucuronokinase
MDFSESIMKSQGHGNYEVMSVCSLPHLWLAYIGDPSDSGAIHSDVSLRWHKGDSEVINAMKKFASLTDEAKEAIEAKDWTLLSALMNRNFDLRRQIYGDDALGAKTIRMVEIGREYGSCVKLPGSGGAVVGMYLEKSQMVRYLLILILRQW